MAHHTKPHGRPHGNQRPVDPEISEIRDLRTAIITEHPDKAELAHAECKGMFTCTKKTGEEREKCFNKHKTGLEGLRGKKKKGGRSRSRSKSRSRSRSGGRRKKSRTRR